MTGIPTEHREKLSGVGKIALIVAIGCGAFLRLYALDNQSLWLDEINTVVPAMFGMSISETMSYTPPSPPLYFMIIQAWATIGGYSEFWLRLPTALLGIAALPLFFLGLRRTFDPESAAIATILLALSWPAIFYAQEVRAYGAVLFTMALAVPIWANILRRVSGETPWRLLATLLGLNLLSAALHPFGMILGAFMYAYLFIGLLRHRPVVSVAAMISAAVVIGAYGVWFMSAAGVTQEIVANGVVFSRPGLSFFVDIGAFLYHHPIPLVLTAAIPLSIGTRAFIGGFPKLGFDVRSPQLFLPIMIVVPFVFVFVVSQFQPFIYTRHLIVFLPFLFILIAIVFQGRDWGRMKKATPAVVAMLCLAATFWIVRDYYVPDKPENRQIADFVLENFDARSVILAPCTDEPPFYCTFGKGAGLSHRLSKYYYYLNRQTLPVAQHKPVPFESQTALLERVGEARRNGYDHPLLLGSRANLPEIQLAVTTLEEHGYRCQTASHHLALAASCLPADRSVPTSE
jgi:hypothetical protein